MDDPEIAAPELPLPSPQAALEQVMKQLMAQSGPMPKCPERDEIERRIDALNLLHDACTQGEIADDTIALNAQGEAMKNPVQNLDKLKASIDGIGRDIAAAAKVLGEVDGFLADFKTFFGVG